jgi:ubiquinone/menaquinone biosynthesis C-methylase UbiE
LRFGNFSKLAEFYVGVDNNKGALHFAKRHFGKGKNYFILADIRNIEFPNKYFDKSMYLGTMHHLTDDDNRLILRKLAKFTQKRLIIIKYAPYVMPSITEKLFLYMERGNYLRSLDKTIELISEFFEVKRCTIILQRTRVAPMSLITCVPKEELQ